MPEWRLALGAATLQRQLGVSLQTPVPLQASEILAQQEFYLDTGQLDWLEWKKHCVTLIEFVSFEKCVCYYNTLLASCLLRRLFHPGETALRI